MKAFSLLTALNFALLSCVCFLHCRAVEAAPGPSGLAEPDSLVVEKHAVPDSLLQVIVGASVRRVASISVVTDSSILVSRKRSLSVADGELFKFLLLEKANFRCDDTLFGRFMPSVIVLMKSGGRKWKASFDFGLGKWALTDLKSRQEWTFDLRSKELLRWAWLQFPEDYLLKTLYLSQE